MDILPYLSNIHIMDRVCHYLDFEDILNLLLVSNITDNIIVNHVDIKTRRIYNLFLQ